MKWLSLLPQLFYGFISVVLVGIAILLMGYALSEVYNAMNIDNASATNELLNAIGIVVISTALVDVSKFLFEEEALHRKRPYSSTREIRRSLSKFLSIIIIAVCMEALVFIFKAGKTGSSSLIYPTLLLLAGIAAVLGLGVFLRIAPKQGQETGLTQKAEQPRRLRQTP
jgi:heme/copper-type cytochrome/quinol oxidase subunit 4